ncbi:MAG: hypothetical protein JXA54_06750 [Candidatus Heimdallarchaeota archaeon]|nr:hypothetical protein [Candidatus Heimdallarchaeota archaeon]
MTNWREKNYWKKVLLCTIVVIFTLSIFANTSLLIEVSIAKEANNNQNDSLLANKSQDILTKVGSWDENYGYCGNVFLSGSRAFLTGEGMVIIDITNPENPFLLGQFKEGKEYSSEGIFVKDNLAFLTSYFSGLRIINITDPTNPTIISRFTEEHYIDVFIKDDYAYLLQYDFYFDILDISDIFHPIKISEIKVSHGSSNEKIFVKDDLAFVGVSFEGLKIIDISNPYNPQELCDYDLYSCNDVFVHDNLAYLAGDDGFALLDVTDPSNPINLSSIDIFYAKGVCYKDGFAFIADYENSMTIINTTNPENVTISGSCNSDVDGLDIKIQGNYTYVAIKPTGLKIIDVSNTSQPKQASVFDCGGFGESVVVRENIAFVANGYDGLVILDVEDKTNPVMLANYVFGKADEIDFQGIRAHDIYLYQNFVLVVLEWNYMCNTLNQFAVINITDLSKPQEICKFGQQFYINDAFIEGSTLYVGGYNGVKIYDLDNITSPELITSYDDFFSTCNTLRKSGNILYAGTTNGLLICDATNPLAISILSTIFTDRHVYAIELTDERAYILYAASSADQICSFDIQDIQNPILKAEYNCSLVYEPKLMVKEKIIFVISADKILIFQETKRAKIEKIGEYQGEFYFYEACISENYLYVASSFDGILIIRINNSSAVSLELLPLLTISALVLIFYGRKKAKKR